MPQDPKHIGEVVLLCMLALFLPPIAVFFVSGCDINFVLNLVLTVFGFWIAGVIHAWALIIYYGLYRTTPQDRIRRRRGRLDEVVAVPDPILAVPGPILASPPSTIQVPRAHQDVAYATPQHGGGEYAQDEQDAQEAQAENVALVVNGGSFFKPGQQQSAPYARDDAWDEGPPRPAPRDGSDLGKKYG